MRIYTRFQPDNLWIKQITDTGYNIQNHDAIRGPSKIIHPNTDAAEATDVNAVTAFKQDGWNMNNTYGSHNAVGKDYISKAWRKGVTPGYDIVQAVKGSGTQSYNHALGVKPDFMVVKDLDYAGSNWHLTAKDFGSEMRDYYNFFTTATPVNSNDIWGLEPTSTQFTLTNSIMTNGSRFIAHLWTGIKGFSKFGKFTGDANANGKYIHCGFRPALIWWRTIDSVNHWDIVEEDNNTGNVCRNRWWITSTQAVPPYGTYYDVLDICAQGFKIRWSDAELNASGQRYVYCAWAAAPSKYSRAR